ncbi:hypothetical protein GCM10011514_29380 [Emticicia aquatilis]|uniref:Uncharacterized protein n=1 Tax=Emticicia aquatilis TaxID=1537369 RepID=A0A916YWR5_9BACT|nr:hypothetical protein [Emticicia aquatilis]GGD63473.1 hypothetical protein GCM10011514_29380 [Emticicia aquatilis]
MNYLNGKEVRLGDVVEITHHDSQKYQTVILEIIEPNSPKAIDWNIPNGGVFVEDPLIGLTMWPYMDEDIILLRRKI